LLHNPVEVLGAPRPDEGLERRIERLSEELRLDGERVRGWVLAQAVLAAFWGLKDGGREWD
jgi:streptomycin 6-kinase